VITIIEVPTAGRYVWWPELGVVGFIEYGRRKACRELHLETRTDNWAGAIRTAARDLVKHSNVINKKERAQA
jgi:hypothetical protein